MFKKIIIPLYKDIAKYILEIIFPMTCLGCNKEGMLICAECLSALNRTNSQICIVCKKPTPFGLTHSYCLNPHSPDALISIFNYHHEKVSKILIFGKYSFLPTTYNILGEKISNILKEDYVNLLDEKNLAITSVPLHNFRKRWRGFNQAQILGESLANNLNLPFQETLKRTKFTQTQKNLKRDQRLKNMEKAFEILPKVDVHNKTLLLVDDVTTTGSTLLEATKVLKRNGANKVFCLTVARD